MTDEQKAKEIVNKVLPCPCPSGYTVMMRGYELEKISVLTAEWKEKEMIDKAIEWLKDQAEHYYGVEGEYSNKVDLIFCKEELLEDFKKYMEE